jgi:multiple sugar transport system permease protein
MSVRAHSAPLHRARGAHDVRVQPARAQHHHVGLPANWWVFVLYVLGLVVVAGPFIWMVASSFKDSQELHAFPPTIVPLRPTLDNYTTLFQKLDFPLFFFNSLIVAAFVVGGNLLFCSMLGYALAKLRFGGRDQIFLIVMATLMVPSTVTLVPLFVLMSSLGLVNSYPALILPFLAGPFGVFLMRQFMLGIPDDLLEAARIDGASELGIFFRVVLPISYAPLATLGILTFLASWNNFLWPLVVSSSERMYTLPVAVAVFSVGQNATDYGLLMAGSTVLVLPVLVVFLALQRYFQPGIATTGLKG